MHGEPGMPELQLQFLQPKAIQVNLEGCLTLTELYLSVVLPNFWMLHSCLKFKTVFVLKLESEISIVVS